MKHKDYKYQAKKIIELHEKGWSENRISYWLMVQNMTWSFSRLNSWYSGCKYCWFQSYILKRRDGLGNAFSEYGVMVHEILEKYLADELSIMELEDVYEEGFKKISEFPPNQYVDLRNTYYKSGKKYLENPDLPSIYEVVEIEKEVRTSFVGFPFVGYIDLVLRHKKSGNIVLLDHKSKGSFDKDSNEIYKYARQMYLYSKSIYQEYGQYPSMLIFNRFRKQEMDRIKFNMDDYKESIEWMMEQIEDIGNAEFFPVTDSEFFSENLCNFRNDAMHIPNAVLTLDDGLDEIHMEV